MIIIFTPLCTLLDVMHIAEDIIMIVENAKYLQQILDFVVIESTKINLSLNINKR